MTKSWVIGVCMLCLAGCYTINDQRFSAHVQTLVQPDIPVDAAIAALQNDGFICDPMLPTPSKTCSKIRQRLLPSTCVERVNLYVSDNRRKVEHVEVRKIMCAGF
jgi:hypothetical protein